jgi:hypothetical protein
MPIPQQVQGERNGRHGRRRVSLAELRDRLSDPSRLDDGSRRRLSELAERLARVQALGDGYASIDFSHRARAALGSGVAAT